MFIQPPSRGSVSPNRAAVRAASTDPPRSTCAPIACATRSAVFPPPFLHSAAVFGVPLRREGCAVHHSCVSSPSSAALSLLASIPSRCPVGLGLVAILIEAIREGVARCEAKEAKYSRLVPVKKGGPSAAIDMRSSDRATAAAAAAAAVVATTAARVSVLSTLSRERRQEGRSTSEI